MADCDCVADVALVVPGLVKKAFTGRPNTKQTAFEIVLLFIELGGAQQVPYTIYSGVIERWLA